VSFRIIAAAAVAGLALTAATAASATTYDITIHGTLTSAVPAGLGFTQDSQVTLHAVFTDLFVVNNGATLTGWDAASTVLSGDPRFYTGQVAPFDITLGPWRWLGGQDVRIFYGVVFQNNDPSHPRFVYNSPNITFTPFGVLRIGGDPGLYSTLGYFDTGTSFTDTTAFRLIPSGGQYIYGVWDYANAVVLTDGVNLAAVPEPATWIELIAGFGLVGFCLRRRRGRLALAS
jgi:hypothetical protein